VRGYFGIGVEGISKTFNVGNLFRSAHAFDASFVFTVDAVYKRGEGAKADTSDAPGHVPFYSFPDVQTMVLPEGCSLVGVELIDGAAELPSFRHPQNAAYVLGPERGSLSKAMLERCDYTIKIPTKFCVNVGIAGAIVMYDRLTSLGRFPVRPVSPGGKPEPLAPHQHGGPVRRRERREQREMEPFRDTPPDTDAEDMMKVET
jgi:tRNA G18 (ribose-2'-O)-methylase SpoU